MTPEPGQSDPSCAKPSLHGWRLGRRRLIGIVVAGLLAIGLGSWLMASQVDSARRRIQTAPAQRGLTPEQEAEWHRWCGDGSEALALTRRSVQQMLLSGMMQPFWAEMSPVIGQALLEALAPGPARQPSFGEAVAPFTLADLDGKPYRLEDVLGKRPIVLQLSSYS